MTQLIHEESVNVENMKIIPKNETNMLQVKLGIKQFIQSQNYVLALEKFITKYLTSH